MLVIRKAVLPVLEMIVAEFGPLIGPGVKPGML
jgi:hypothetical protein